MKRILLILIFLLFSPSLFADSRSREIEYEALNLVIEKYGSGLENRLKGTGSKTSYRTWYENECFVSVAAGTYKEYEWLTLEWFSVNVCSGLAELIEVNRQK